jgi:hypothetical protein
MIDHAEFGQLGLGVNDRKMQWTSSVFFFHTLFNVVVPSFGHHGTIHNIFRFTFHA